MAVCLRGSSAAGAGRGVSFASVSFASGTSGFSSFGAGAGSVADGGTRLNPENGLEAAGAGGGAVGKKEMPEKGLLVAGAEDGGASSPALLARTFLRPAITAGSGCHSPGSS